MPALAGDDALSLAASEIEHFLRDQVVVQDDIRRLQGAHRFQGQQFRISRACSHQGDTAQCRISFLLFDAGQ